MNKKFKINGDNYIYDINRMSARRILQAVSLFKLQQRMEMNMPAQIDELKTMITKETEANAIAAILMKCDIDSAGNVSNIAKYDPYNINAVDMLDGIEGIDKLNEVMECKTDFFQRTELASLASLMQLNDLIPMLEKMKDSEMLTEVLTAAANSQSSSEGKRAKPAHTKITKKKNASS